jgi:chromosomal replication initiation ATPase DnaA
MNARSQHREARQVLIEISYRLNVSGRSLQKIGDELGGISGAAVMNSHVRLQEKMLRDRTLGRRLERICDKVYS